MAVVLITGTSSGIGLAAAHAALRAGWTTVATMRDPSRGEALRDAGADVRALDVTSSDSIASCLEGVVAEHGGLDALVNNAGAASLGTVENVDMAEFRAALEVNFFGVVMMTKAAMPLLRAARGRLITVTSVGGIVGQPFNEAYCAAKFAVEGFHEALAPNAAAHGVRCTVVEPGAVASEFINNAGLDPASVISSAGVYAPQLQNYLSRVMSQFGSGAQTSDEVGQQIADLLDDPAPPLRVQTSDWSREFVAGKLRDTDGSGVFGMTSTWV